MKFDELNEENYLLFAIKYYENPHAATMEDFEEDLHSSLVFVMEEEGRKRQREAEADPGEVKLEGSASYSKTPDFFKGVKTSLKTDLCKESVKVGKKKSKRKTKACKKSNLKRKGRGKKSKSKKVKQSRKSK